MTWLLDAILLGTAVEAVVLFRVARFRLLNLLSGMCLLVALRVALGGGGPIAICAALAAAGALHALDFLVRES